MVWKIEQFYIPTMELPEEFSRKQPYSRLTWRKWTEEEVARLAENKGKFGFYEKFAKETGRSISSVRSKAEYL